MTLTKRHFVILHNSFIQEMLFMAFKELFILELLIITQYDIKIKISQYASILSFSNYSS
jgi:hypothetical protein